MVHFPAGKSARAILFFAVVVVLVFVFSAQHKNNESITGPLNQQMPADEPVARPSTPSPAPTDAVVARTEERRPARSGNLLDRIFSRGRCEGSGTKVFTAAPMRPEDTDLVVPLGHMVKGHVTPIDHQYFSPTGFLSNPKNEVPIFAPADGYIVMVNRYGETQVEGDARDGYDLFLEYTCDFYSQLGLLTRLPPDIAEKIGTVTRGKQKYVRIPVKAGDIVAYVAGQTLDLYTYDINTPAKQWVVPAHYSVGGDGEKKYITDAFLYMSAPVRDSLMAKNPRVVEPRGGRFDYDIDGRLVGTWFKKGTDGYSGYGFNTPNYWKTHLVFAYNVLDPRSIEISMGSWNGDDTGHQFAVKGNTPDPKEVSVASGPVKYELWAGMFTTANGDIWSRVVYAGPVTRSVSQDFFGTVLVQMTGDRQVKIERFPGKRASEVSGFTDAAELYER